ncbi:MAG TPA: hypothetical protein PL151_07870 [Phycisphaerae bacterium]|nr:hypothetical protein [Phycisphaerae bacterium]HOJ73146.1 hypothetical protein [Phycisphaerae bacterium]HOM52201.1 hypothetical protein [Phycisphaerae bacterium]HON65700.1 hypothetical protein [Phycisphaerae bacterium]HOQ88380.1 hypothetical protein [Phycisphaerae bacterium]
MAQAGPNGPQVEAHDSLYTTLLIVSAATLLIGIIIMISRSIQFFGSIWPSGSAS